jgi:hypothetical protein
VVYKNSKSVQSISFALHKELPKIIRKKELLIFVKAINKKSIVSSSAKCCGMAHRISK